MTHHTWDAIVIGGGAAGLSAAQALGRALRRTLVIDAGSPRNRFAAHVHNALGLDGKTPVELMVQGREEAERYGVEFRAATVNTVSELERGMRVALESGEQLDARALIVATGARDVLPEIPGLAEHWGTGVMHCPYCHGWEVRGRRIGVVATSPLSLHQAKMLRQWSEDITVFSAEMGEIDEASLRKFAARGVKLVPAPVARLVGDGAKLTVVVTEDGAEYPIDGVFAMSSLEPIDGFLAGIDLPREEQLGGNFVVADGFGQTGHPRIWAAGNVVHPMATVPVAMGAGAMAGAMANGALLEEDYELAVHDLGHEYSAEDPKEFWECRYAESDRIWSGRVNQSLAVVAADWNPGRSLDLGCGEGADVLWLAERGWDATGIDLSQTAVSRATAEAKVRKLTGARFVAADLSDWAEQNRENDGAPVGEIGGPYDLITASFMQSPVELPREGILRAALSRLAPGGRLVVVSHAAPPPWAKNHPGEFLSPSGELALLKVGLSDIAREAGSWFVEVAEVRSRSTQGPDGHDHLLEDTVVVVRRND